MTNLFRDLLGIVSRNINGEDDDSAERQRLAVNASKELRAILADIAIEAGGRNLETAKALPPNLELAPLSTQELASLIGLDLETKPELINSKKPDEVK